MADVPPPPSWGVDVELLHLWGCNTAVHDSVSFAGKSALVYPAGRRVVSQRLDGGAMNFLPQHDQHLATTAVSVSPNHRFVAVCESYHRSSPCVKVMDLRSAPSYRTLQTLRKPDSLPGATITACAFSGDSKYIAVQTGEPEWSLAVWKWESSKLLCATELAAPVTHLSFNPFDNTQLCCSGHRVFRLWRIIGAEVSAFPPFAGVKSVETVNDHTWTEDDRVVAVTQHGRIMVIDDCDVRQEFQSPVAPATGRPGTSDHARSPTAERSRRVALNAVASYSSGFVIGGHHGKLMFFEMDQGDFSAHAADDKPTRRKPVFIHTRTLDVLMGGVPVTVHSFGLCPARETLALCVDGGMGSMALSSVGLLPDAVTAAPVVYVSERMHTGPVTSLSVCASKPLLATCSTDGSVVLWNYQQRRAVARRVFASHSGPLSVAVHPSGHYLLVVVPGRVLLLSVVQGEIHDGYDVAANGATTAAFSSDGGKFAAAVNKQAWVFATFGPRGPIHLGSMFGHSRAVARVSWTHGDTRLVTAGMDGTVYHWSLKNLAKPNRDGECITGHHVEYFAAAASQSGVIVAAFDSGEEPDHMDDVASPQHAPMPGGGGGAVPRITTVPHTRSKLSIAVDKPADRPASRSARGATKSVVVRPTALTGPLTHGVALWNGVVEPPPSVALLPDAVTAVSSCSTVLGDIVWVGNTHGDVLQLKTPFEGGSVARGGSLVALSTHQGPVTSIAVATNTVFLFTCSTDGSVAMAALTKLADKALRAGNLQSVLLTAPGSSVVPALMSPTAASVGESVTNVSRAERRTRQLLGMSGSPDGLVLVAESHLNHQVETIATLQANLEDERRLAEAKLMSELDAAELERMADRTEAEREHKDLVKRYEMELQDLQTEKGALEVKLRDQEARHMDVMTRTEADFEAKAAALADQTQRLQSSLDDMAATGEAHDRERQLVNEAAKRKIVDHCKSILEKSKVREDDLQSYVEYVKKEFDVMIESQEKAHDVELFTLQQQIEQLNTQMDGLRAQLKAERTQMARTVTSLREKIDKAAAEKATLEQLRLGEVAKRKATKADLEAVKTEFSEQHNALRQRDTQLSTTEAKILDLERSRRVLQQQLSGYVASVAPKDKEIAMLRSQIEELDAEFKVAQKASLKTAEVAERKAQRLNLATSDLRKTESRLRAREAVLVAFRRQLDALVTAPSVEWKQGILELHRTFVAELNLAGDGDAVDRNLLKASGDVKAVGAPDGDLDSAALEFKRQRAYMERGISVLQRQAQRERDQAASGMAAQLKENAQLLEDLNALRREHKLTLATLGKLEREAASLRVMNSTLSQRADVVGRHTTRRPSATGTASSPGTETLSASVDRDSTSLPVAHMGGRLAPSRSRVIKGPASRHFPARKSMKKTFSGKSLTSVSPPQPSMVPSASAPGIRSDAFGTGLAAQRRVASRPALGVATLTSDLTVAFPDDNLRRLSPLGASSTRARVSPGLRSPGSQLSRPVSPLGGYGDPAPPSVSRGGMRPPAADAKLKALQHQPEDEVFGNPVSLVGTAAPRKAP